VSATAEHTTATTALMEPTPGEVRRRQRDEWGGISWGAAFFGWVVAIGIGALLTGFVGAVGTAIALTEVEPDTIVDGEGLGIGVVGAVALIAVALVSYLAGGYVAGRMSRFDGARQGLAVWAFGLLVAAGLALAGVIAGGEYNLLGRLELPRIPVGEGTVTEAGVAVLVTIPVAALLAAVAGGVLGERYHRAIDRTGA
jgi:hypothetical protein